VVSYCISRMGLYKKLHRYGLFHPSADPTDT
jgi:hypothetical protein